jgi:hypothetical protein
MEEIPGIKLLPEDVDKYVETCGYLGFMGSIGTEKSRIIVALNDGYYLMTQEEVLDPIVKEILDKEANEHFDSLGYTALPV